ncbi:MAG: radical SAM protein [Planctomycetes bacterium]|nr:radical SAM protein [Planctomycetota bacterium]
MKILFVYSFEDAQSVSKPIRSWSDIQFGISYISSVLKTHGHQTQLLVLGSNNRWRNNEKLVRTAIEEFGPQIICFTAVASQYTFIKKTAGFIKNQWPDNFLVIGGVHATLNPSEVLSDFFDALCIGEGEHPMVELCAQLEKEHFPREIANLWIKSRNGSVEKNPTRPFLEKLDSLPFPDRAMWKPWMKEQVGAGLSVLLGRGCPYSCTYCCNHAIKKVATGKYIRTRSPKNIIEEIAFLHDEFPAQKQIYFEVESIALDKPWLIDLLAKLEEFNSTIDNSISYGGNFRISSQSIDENIFILLEKANFYKINIGLEAGSERVRREVLKRNYSNKNFLDVVSMARKHGLKVWVFNMIGLPEETYDDHMETVSLNRQCQPDAHYTGIFFPYPGTELYNTCIEKGFINSASDIRMERIHAVIDSPNFTKKQIQNSHIRFNYRVYKGHRPLWKILIQTVMVKVYFNSTANFLFRRLVQLPVISHIRSKLVNQ